MAQFDFRKYIAGIIRYRGFQSVAEVGVFKGQLSRILWAMPSITKLILVDPYDASYQGLGHPDWVQHFDSRKGWNQEKFDELHDRVVGRMPGHVTMMRMPSTEAAEQIADGSLDFVFIDALHYYEDLKEDIAAWLPKIVAGGMLSGDDMSTPFPGVQKAVEERFGVAGYQREGRVWRVDV